MNTDTREKILIVDDDIINTKLLANLLETNYTVITANNGTEAIYNAYASPPDLILLDILMPDMDGLEVFDWLKHHSNTSYIPVIFVTSKNTQHDKSSALQLGAVDYIVKPFDAEVIVQRVKKNLMR